MQPFKNILVIVHDETTAALNEAVILVRGTNAKLTVASVIESKLGDSAQMMGAISESSLLENIIAARTEALEQIAAPIREEGIQVSVKIMLGTPFIEIIREVLREGYDLLMITPDEESVPRSLIFGSTIMHLMRKAPCPVWAIKPTHTGRFARIMAAVDPSTPDTERNALNAKILNVAISLSRMERSELHIVHTWRLYGESILRGPRFKLSAGEINQMLRETRQAHRMQLQELLSNHNLRDVDYHVHLPKGDPGVLIPKLAVRHKIDLIVMGTVCRTGIAGLLIGNTAETVLRRVNRSVLALKPDGFVSPVKLDA